MRGIAFARDWTGSGEGYVVPPMAEADNLQRVNEGNEGWQEWARVPKADYVKYGLLKPTLKGDRGRPLLT
jgi:hypothetical protein